MRQVWTAGSAGAGALSPGTDACGIAGGTTIIAILKKIVAGQRADRAGLAAPSVTQAGGVVHCGTTGLGRTVGIWP
jgi:hypothetical protein